MRRRTEAPRSAQLELSEALRDFFKAARRARGRAARDPSPRGLSIAQYHLLEPLASGPRTNRELAELAGIAPPTATRLVDGLLQRGFVSRVEDPTDRRAVVISLTPAGRTALAKKEREYAAGRARIAEALEPHEQEVAAELLRRLAAVIEEL
jgi:MarR family transcriptional regulator, lower aerobic nicotinate degradation pathway regulator